MQILTIGRRALGGTPVRYGYALVIRPWPDATVDDFVAQLRSSPLAAGGILVKVSSLGDGKVELVVTSLTRTKECLRANGIQARLLHLLPDQI